MGRGDATFDASDVVPTTIENRPTNIALLPLIAFRNITGRFPYGLTALISSSFGTISYVERIGNLLQFRNIGAEESYTQIFDANLDSNSYGNPMHGHADSSEIRPFNISLFPLIAY